MCFMNLLKSIILGLSLLNLNLGQAQFSIGINEGVVRAWQNYGESVLPENAVTHVFGYELTTFLKYKMSKSFSFSSNLGLQRRGAACVPGWEPIFEADTKFYLTYLDVPLILNYHLPILNQKLELIGSLGYGFAYLIKGVREEMVNFSGTKVTRTTMDLENSKTIINRFDHGFHTGLSLGYNIGRSQLLLSSRYYYGLVDAERFNTSKNRALNLTLGLNFNLGKKK